MAFFIELLINGITMGAVYGLVAIGYTMVYGIIGMINFAHGEIYMIGAMITVITLVTLASLGVAEPVLAIGTALLVTMALTSVYGWTLERIAYRPLRGSNRLAPLISAIGASIFLQNAVQLVQGARVKPIRPLIDGAIVIPLAQGDVVTIGYLQIFIVALTVATVTGLTLLVSRTALGRAMRACSQDMGMAALLGLDVNRVIATTFVIGAALASVAGLIVTLYYGVVDFYMGFLAGVKAFTAAVLGGIGSLPGAVLGGLLIGLVEALWSGFFPIEYKDVAVFGILVLVLIFRPSGLLGQEEVEKV